MSGFTAAALREALAVSGTVVKRPDLAPVCVQDLREVKHLCTGACPSCGALQEVRGEDLGHMCAGILLQLTALLGDVAFHSGVTLHLNVSNSLYGSHGCYIGVSMYIPACMTVHGLLGQYFIYPVSQLLCATLSPHRARHS